MQCDWCAREGGSAVGVIQISRGDLRVSVSPVFCRVCCDLVLPEAVADDPEDVYEAESDAAAAVDDELARIYASGIGSRDRCWWCSRDAAPLPSTQSEGGRVLFEDPVVCDICAALTRHVPYGFADADERRRDAVDRVLEMLVQDARPSAARQPRQRADELIIAKIALLESDFSEGDFCAPGDGYMELAGSLGLSVMETKAEVSRLRNQAEAPVTFRRVDGVVSPTLSARGRLRLSMLLREFRLGPPYSSSALGSAPLRKTLAQLDGAATPA